MSTPELLTTRSGLVHVPGCKALRPDTECWRWDPRNDGPGVARACSTCLPRGLPPGPVLDAFNAGTSRAIAANRADRLVADGLCEVCGVKRHDDHLRTCSGCRRARTQARRKSA